MARFLSIICAVVGHKKKMKSLRLARITCANTHWSEWECGRCGKPLGVGREYYDVRSEPEMFSSKYGER